MRVISLNFYFDFSFSPFSHTHTHSLSFSKSLSPLPLTYSPFRFPQYLSLWFAIVDEVMDSQEFKRKKNKRKVRKRESLMSPLLFFSFHLSHFLSLSSSLFLPLTPSSLSSSPSLSLSIFLPLPPSLPSQGITRDTYHRKDLH